MASEAALELGSPFVRGLELRLRFVWADLPHQSQSRLKRAVLELRLPFVRIDLPRITFVWAAPPHETPFQLSGFLGAAFEPTRLCRSLIHGKLSSSLASGSEQQPLRRVWDKLPVFTSPIRYDFYIAFHNPLLYFSNSYGHRSCLCNLATRRDGMEMRSISKLL